MSAVAFVVDMAGTAVGLLVEFAGFVARFFGHDFSDSGNSQYLGDV